MVAVGFLLIVHFLVLKQRIERGKIGSLDRHYGRRWKLLRGGDPLQHVGGGDRGTRRQEPTQRFFDHFKPFVLGGVQQLEILLDRGGFRRVLEQLIVGHTEPRRGVHVVDVLVVDERTGLANQRVDHVAKVDHFLAAAELPRHAFHAFAAQPEFQMVLVNAHFQWQADVFAAYRVRVSLHANDAVGLHRHEDRSAGRTTLRRHGAQRRKFLAEPLLPRGVPPAGQLTHERHVVVGTGEVAASPQSQRLVQPIFEVAVRRFHVAVFMRFADIDAMAAGAVVRQQSAVRCGELFVAGKVVDRGRQTVAAGNRSRPR
jgi:hypothetical protein